MINVNVHAVEFLPEKHRLTLLMDKSTCFCMLVSFFNGAALFSSSCMGKFRQTKKDLLGKSSQGSRNKVSWKAFLQALGKCLSHKKNGLRYLKFI
jgi:hypothetical protein